MERRPIKAKSTQSSNQSDNVTRKQGDIKQRRQTNRGKNRITVRTGHHVLRTTTEKMSASIWAILDYSEKSSCTAAFILSFFRHIQID